MRGCRGQRCGPRLARGDGRKADEKMETAGRSSLLPKTFALRCLSNEKTLQFLSLFFF